MTIAAMRDDLMVQQQLPAEDLWCRRWQHMVAVIMLNQTGRRAVKQILPEFLSLWPNPERFLSADKDHVQAVIAPLGLGTVRTRRLLGMTRDYVTWDGDRADQLYGIGQYGSDSYEIFFKNNYAVQPLDRELQRYLSDLHCTKY